MASRIDKKNTSVNHQGHSREEGQQGNIPPIDHTDGQRQSNNRGQSISNMMQDSEEQLAGRKNQQRGEDEKERDGVL